MITLGNLTGLGRRFVRDGCTGKQAFPTYATAEAEIARLLRKHADRPELGQIAAYAYACGYCHRYHLGHFRERDR